MTAVYNAHIAIHGMMPHSRCEDHQSLACTAWIFDRTASGIFQMQIYCMPNQILKDADVLPCANQKDVLEQLCRRIMHQA